MSTILRKPAEAVSPINHRPPTNEELEVLLAVLTNATTACLVPVLFNGERRYALGLGSGQSVYVLGIVPVCTDQLLDMQGRQPENSLNSVIRGRQHLIPPL